MGVAQYGGLRRIFSTELFTTIEQLGGGRQYVIAKEDVGEFRLFNRLRLSETGSGSVDGKDKP